MEARGRSARREATQERETGIQKSDESPKVLIFATSCSKMEAGVKGAAEPYVISLADVEAAAKNIEGVANKTPVMTSGCMDGLAGACCACCAAAPPSPSTARWNVHKQHLQNAEGWSRPGKQAAY